MHFLLEAETNFSRSNSDFQIKVSDEYFTYTSDGTKIKQQF